MEGSMSFGTRVFNIMSGSLALVAVLSCSKEQSKSQLASVSVNPGKPIVITADATIDGDKKIEGPWFAFTLSMTNASDEPITIVAIEAEVFAQGSSGQTETTTIAFTPGDFNFKIGEDKECKFTSFGTWDPTATPSTATRGFELENGDGACTRTPLFYIGSNPSGPNGNNFRYRVKLKPQGWFGGLTSATNRFDRSINFYTQ
jgi:hypothetical protein